jgi:hypothetical protein
MSNELKIINPFTDIVPLSVTDISDNNNDYKQWSMGGGGENGLKADSQGLWFGAKKYANAPFKIDMNGNVTAASLTITGGTVKYGKTSFSDTTNAGYYMGSEGIYFGSASDATKLKYAIGTGVFDFVGTVSGRSTAVIASAINAGGNVITELINAKLDTSTKEILGDFTFGVSGAIKMITNVDNGLWLSPTGLLGKKSGATTFSITTSGDATFAGTLSAAAGTLGTITSAEITGGTITGVTITGGTIRTSSGNSRCVMDGSNNIISIFSSNVERLRLTEDRINFINSSGNTIGRIYTPSTTVAQLEALSGNYLVLNAVGSAYSIDFQNAGSSIAYVSSGGITVQSGKKITTPEVEATYVTGVNTVRFSSTASPLTDNGSIYFNGSHFYGRIGGSWVQLDN